MANNLNPLPWAKFPVNLPPGLLELSFQRGNLTTGLNFLFSGEFAQLLEPFFELGEGLLKLQWGDGLGLRHKG